MRVRIKVSLAQSIIIKKECDKVSIQTIIEICALSADYDMKFQR